MREEWQFRLCIEFSSEKVDRISVNNDTRTKVEASQTARNIVQALSIYYPWLLTHTASDNALGRLILLPLSMPTNLVSDFFIGHSLTDSHRNLMLLLSSECSTKKPNSFTSLHYDCTLLLLSLTVQVLPYGSIINKPVQETRRIQCNATQCKT